MKKDGSAVISIRLNEKVKHTLEENRVDLAQEVKAHLNELAQRIEFRKKLEELTLIIKSKVKPSKSGFAVKSVREDRYEMH